MTEIAPNMAQNYRQAYEYLFSCLKPEIKEQVKRAQENDTLKMPSEVRAFVKSVILMAERGS
jgi:hypothetical protein